MDAVGKTMDGKPSAEKVNVLMQVKTSEVVTSEVFLSEKLTYIRHRKI